MLLRTAIVALLALQAAAPVSVPAPGSIEGFVRQLNTQLPISGAEVTLTRGQRSSNPLNPTGYPALADLTVLTGDDGHFTFNDIAPGPYVVKAQREGYFNEQSNPDVRLFLTVNANQNLRNTTLSLVPSAAIGGTIFDPDGDPLPRASVSIWSASYADESRNGQLNPYPHGRRFLSPARVAYMGGQVDTDDRGEYRLFGLPPGEYYIAAQARAPRAPLVPVNPETIYPTFYPGTKNAASAVLVKLAAGTDLNGLNFGLQAPVTVTIRGRIVDSFSAQPVRVDLLHLVQADPNALETSSLLGNPPRPLVLANRASVTDAANGVFEIGNIFPGVYDLMPEARVTDKLYTGRTRIEVADRNIDGLALNVQPGVTVDGRIVVNGTAALSPRIRVSLRPMESFPRRFSPGVSASTSDPRPPGTGAADVPPTVGIDTAGVFAIHNVRPGRYHLFVTGLPANMYVAEISSGVDRVLSSGLIVGDVSPKSLDIALREGTGTIQGSIEIGQNLTAFADQRLIGTPNGPPVLTAAAGVVLVPDSARRENPELFVRSAASVDGQFEFRGVPPGQYKVFAVVGVSAATFANADFIARHEALGHFVTLAPSGVVNLQLKLLKEIR